MAVEDVKEELKAYGQEHLLQFWSILDEDERGNLLREIKEYESRSQFFFFRFF